MKTLMSAPHETCQNVPDLETVRQSFQFGECLQTCPISFFNGSKIRLDLTQKEERRVKILRIFFYSTPLLQRSANRKGRFTVLGWHAYARAAWAPPRLINQGYDRRDRLTRCAFSNLGSFIGSYHVYSESVTCSKRSLKSGKDVGFRRSYCCDAS